MDCRTRRGEGMTKKDRETLMSLVMLVVLVFVVLLIGEHFRDKKLISIRSGLLDSNPQTRAQAVSQLQQSTEDDDNPIESRTNVSLLDDRLTDSDRSVRLAASKSLLELYRWQQNKVPALQPVTENMRVRSLYKIFVESSDSAARVDALNDLGNWLTQQIATGRMDAPFVNLQNAIKPQIVSAAHIDPDHDVKQKATTIAGQLWPASTEPSDTTITTQEFDRFEAAVAPSIENFARTHPPGVRPTAASAPSTLPAN